MGEISCMGPIDMNLIEGNIESKYCCTVLEEGLFRKKKWNWVTTGRLFKMEQASIH